MKIGRKKTNFNEKNFSVKNKYFSIIIALLSEGKHFLVCTWVGHYLVCTWVGHYLVCTWVGPYLVCTWVGPYLVCTWVGHYLGSQFLMIRQQSNGLL